MSVAIVFASCSKDTTVNGACCDPISPIEIIKDSISAGSKYGITIGDDVEKVYADFQLYAQENKHEYLGIVRPAYTKLEEVKELLPYYSSLYLKSVQFSFKDDKVASIFLTNGDKVNEWPVGYSTTVKVNDPVNVIYDKLETIRKRVNFTHLFDHFNLNFKLIDKPLDLATKQSDKWYFRFKTAENTFEYAELRFTNDRLSSIFFQKEVY